MILYDEAADSLRYQMPTTQPATLPQNLPHAFVHHSVIPPPIHQHIPAPQPVIHQQQVDWTARIAEVIQDQFGLKPKVQTYTYRTPYPPAYDLLPFPHRYKVPDFTKFSGMDDTSTVEHVNRFIIQCGEAATQDALRVRLFSSSLSGSAFQWFTTLPPNSSIRE